MADKNSNKTEQDFCYCSVSEAQEIFGLKDADEVIAQCEANKLPFTKTGNWYRIAVERKRYEEYLRSKQVRPDIDITPEQMDYVRYCTISEAKEMFGYKDNRTVLKLCQENSILYIRFGNDYRIAVDADRYEEYLSKKAESGKEGDGQSQKKD